MPAQNSVSVWVDEESQKNNIPHLRETVALLTLTCAYNELVLSANYTFTNVMWNQACEWVYFRSAAAVWSVYCALLLTPT